MDEEEYDEYLSMVFGEIPFDENPVELARQARDDDGFRVDGCYRISPAPTD